MKLLLIWISIQALFSGGIVTFDFISHQIHNHKVLGVLQMISAMICTVLTNCFIPRDTVMYWGALIGIILLLICGMVNLIRYLCSGDSM